MQDKLSQLKPVNIGAWRPYNILLREEQLRLQEDNLISTGLQNGSGELRFIFTEYLSDANEYLEQISKEVSITDTEVVLEDEVFYTSKIEGAKTTRVRTSEIHNGAFIDDNNRNSELMVKNGFEAVKLLNLYGNNINEEILLKVWNTLIKDVCENAEIRGITYRTGDVFVGSHQAPEASKVAELMTQFYDFYHSPTLENYPFLKAALLHYAFETIHPFCDGNGRMGRLLINNYLLSRGIDSAKAVSFSMQIDASRSHYDVAFIDSENDHNDCTPFLTYMMEIMSESYHMVQQVQKSQKEGLTQ